MKPSLEQQAAYPEHTRIFQSSIYGMETSCFDMAGDREDPSLIGGDEIGNLIWYRINIVQKMLLLTGALPSELQ